MHENMLEQPEPTTKDIMDRLAGLQRGQFVIILFVGMLFGWFIAR